MSRAAAGNVDDVERKLFGAWFKPVVGALLGALGYFCVTTFRASQPADGGSLGSVDAKQWEKISNNSERLASLEARMTGIETAVRENSEVSKQILRVVLDKRSG
jgi:hypothetical protein